MTNYIDITNDMLEPRENQMMNDICSFLNSVKPSVNKDRRTKATKKNPIEIPTEDRAKMKPQKMNGLNDNILADYEYKNKARKGLQYLLYKMSEGRVCSNIKDYYLEIRDKAIGEGSPIRKKPSDMSNNKKLRRQNLYDKFTKRDSLKAEEVAKVTFNKDKGNKLTATLSSLILKKREKNKKVTTPITQDKFFKDDIKDDELNLFYSEKELEIRKQKFQTRGQVKKRPNKGKKYYNHMQHEPIKENDMMRLNIKDTSNSISPPLKNIKEFTTPIKNHYDLKHSQSKLSFLLNNLNNSD